MILKIVMRAFKEEWNKSQCSWPGKINRAIVKNIEEYQNKTDIQTC